MLLFELFEEAERGLQDLGAEGQAWTCAQLRGGLADELDELVGDGSAGRVGGQGLQGVCVRKVGRDSPRRHGGTEARS